MAVLTAGVTLADWRKTRDPDGGIAKIVELLDQKNQILEDIPWMEGNLPTGHQSTIRTGLPTSAWRLLNAQTPASKATEAQVTEACGMVESVMEIDKDIVELGGNAQGYLATRFPSYVESMRQEVVQTIFYGNSTTAPEEFTGLSPRYSSLSAENGQNIINMAGTATLTSVWFIDWGPGITGIFPKGTDLGLKHDYRGIEVKETSTGISRVYRSFFSWKCGITVPDWRSCVRICNVPTDTGAASLDGTAPVDLIQAFIRALVRLPSSMSSGSTRIYMNRTVWSWLDIQARSLLGKGTINATGVGGGGLTYSDVDGIPRWSFRGIPIRICDQLINSETAVA